jgi:hypothetical protein
MQLKAPFQISYLIISMPIIGMQMEEARVHCSAEAIDLYFEQLKSYCDGIDAHFIFNADEMGAQDYVDASPTVVFVPEEFNASSIPVPVDRSGKRSTLLACDVNDGSFLKPLVVVTRKSIDDELIKIGLTFKKLSIAHSPTWFITEELFHHMFQNIYTMNVALITFSHCLYRRIHRIRCRF